MYLQLSCELINTARIACHSPFWSHKQLSNVVSGTSEMRHEQTLKSFGGADIRLNDRRRFVAEVEERSRDYNAPHMTEIERKHEGVGLQPVPFNPSITR